MDAAAALELRGYAGTAPGRAHRGPRSPVDAAFWLTAAAIWGLAAACIATGAVTYESYPGIELGLEPLGLALVLSLPRARRHPSHPGGSMAMSDPVVSFERFSYRYPGSAAPSLRDVDLKIEEGEFVVLAGRSAAGKSTLLRAACGLVPHFHGGEAAGSAAVCGNDLREHGPAELQGAVGLVAQDPEAQVVAATVRGELELPLEIAGEPAASRARAVEEASLALGIAHLLGRSTQTLSGGELQRVALAAALVGRPRVVLLDEPTSQLDPVAGDELIGLLRRLNEEWGTTIVLAEHRLERCLAAADRVVAMAEGRVAFDGEPDAYLDWALDSDAALATPLARLFDGAGMRPAPVSVKEARSRLAAQAAVPPSGTPKRPTASPIGDESGRFGAKGGKALRVKRLWVELDHGEGPHEVIRDLSLRVEPGEIVALMGRNGAGKSTLLRSVAGLVEPRRGKAEAPAGWSLVPQAPGDLLVRERVGDELPGARGRGGCSRRWGWRAPRMRIRGTCRAASASGSHWRSRWRAAPRRGCRGSSAWTSRPAGWTPPASTSSQRDFATSRQAAPRCSWPRTTSSSPPRSPSAWC